VNFLNPPPVSNGSEVEWGLGQRAVARKEKYHHTYRESNTPTFFVYFKDILGVRSTLSTESKFLLYKLALIPNGIYGIQLWGTSSNSNIDILQRFQSILHAPWYINNHRIRVRPTNEHSAQ
jgi:hypothetical protein